MTTPELQAAARALCDVLDKDDWDDVPPIWRLKYLEAAAAVIKSLLPVSDDLLNGGLNSRIVFVPGTHQPERDETSRNIITAALNHALKGTE